MRLNKCSLITRHGSGKSMRLLAYAHRSSVRPNLNTKEPAKMKAFCMNKLTPGQVAFELPGKDK